MGAAASAENDIETIRLSILEKLKTVKESHPNNLTAKYLTEDLINSLSQDSQRILYKCAISGLQNPDSQLGCYAMTPKDYETFKDFFDKVIREYHGDDSGTKVHETNWDLNVAGKYPSDGEATGSDEPPNTLKLDLKDLGLEEVSMRIRVGRNLTCFNLPGMMTREERISFEQLLLPIFDNFIANESLKGKVYSLTPDFNIGEENKENPNLINEEKYQELIGKHLMFKNMHDDAYLREAGISSDWPYGRGCYISEKEDFIVWFGEEDHLRIMCMAVGTRLDELLVRLKTYLDDFTLQDKVVFAKSENYGYITSCPSNLGTGMRASVHVKVPHLVKKMGLEKIKLGCAEHKLGVRGVGGEHTDIGEDGTIDLSPKSRLFITEAQIIQDLYNGIKLVLSKESAAASNPEKGAECAEADKAVATEATATDATQS